MHIDLTPCSASCWLLADEKILHRTTSHAAHVAETNAQQQAMLLTNQIPLKRTQTSGGRPQSCGKSQFHSRRRHTPWQMMTLCIASYFLDPLARTQCLGCFSRNVSGANRLHLLNACALTGVRRRRGNSSMELRLSPMHWCP